MSDSERIDSYVQPNEGTEYKLSIGEKLEAVKAFSDLVGNVLLDNADKIKYQEDPTELIKAKIELNSIGQLDSGRAAAVSAHRTYFRDDSHEDLMIIYDIPDSLHVYSTTGDGSVRRFDMEGENARELLLGTDLEVVDHQNIMLEQRMGINNQPVDADEIAQLKQAVGLVLESN